MKVFTGLFVVVTMFAQDPVSDAAWATVQRWDNNSDFRMSEAAKTEVVNAVTGEREILQQAERVNGPPEPYWVTRQLVRHYCFDLRDRRWRENRHVHVPFVMAWQQPTLALTIEPGDVRALSFRSVLERIFDGLRPRPTGTLDVKSLPPRADIAIDRRVLGFSNRVFVVTAGTYAVEVRPSKKKPCSSTVEIRANQVAEVSCGSR